MARIIRSKIFPVVVALALMLAIAPQGMPAAVNASAPYEHKVTNVNDVSFTVSWITAVEETGYVEYGTTTALGSIAHDERGAGTIDDTHHVVVDGGLMPNQEYYYDIISGGDRDDNGGLHYTVTIGPTLDIPQPDDILGEVLKNDGSTSAEGTIVYITVTHLDVTSQELSTLVESSGWWGVNLGGVRTQDYQAHFSYVGADLVSLFAQGAVDGSDVETPTVEEVRSVEPWVTTILQLVDLFIPPTMETIAEPEGQYYNTAPSFSNFGFDDNMALDDGWYQIDSYGGAWIALFTDVSGTSWDDNGWVLLDDFGGLNEGSHTVYFKASDDTGNVEGESGEWSWQFFKDITPPSNPADVHSTSHTLQVWSNEPPSATSIWDTAGCLMTDSIQSPMFPSSFKVGIMTERRCTP